MQFRSVAKQSTKPVKTSPVKGKKRTAEDLAPKPSKKRRPEPGEPGYYKVLAPIPEKGRFGYGKAKGSRKFDRDQEQEH